MIRLVAAFAVLAAFGSAASAQQTPPTAQAGVARPLFQPAQPVLHVPAAADTLRMNGEYDRVEWPVYLPAGALPGIRTFQIAFQAAVEVMPEGSTIRLSINGQDLGTIPIAAPGSERVAALDIPPGLLAPGWNAVALDVSQRHRVDCSLASTYELWTEINAARTGFVSGPIRIDSIADLPALLPDLDGQTHLHLILPKDILPNDLSRAVHAVEQVAISGHYAHPVVDTTVGKTGLNIAVGPAAFLAGQPAGLRGTPPSDVSTATDGGLWLAVSDGENASDKLDGAARGSEEGLAALARRSALRLRPGSALNLADLGLKSLAFNGRVLHRAFDIVLPPDAYPADYGEARLAIDGGYAAGLTSDARLIVRVNGIVDGSLDLDRRSGAVLQRQIVHMPLDPFRPGRNRIEIEVQLPAASDAACDTLAGIAAKERLLLLGSSTLSLPPLARVAQFPSLSSTLSGNYRVTPDVAPRVYLSRIGDASIAAAATLLANAAVGTGVTTGAALYRGLPPEDGKPAMMVGEAHDLAAKALDASGVDAQSAAQAWRAGLKPVGGSPDAATRALPGASDAARLDAWGERVEDNNGWLGGSGSLLSALTDRLGQSLRSSGIFQGGEQPLRIDGDTSFVMSQAVYNGMPLTLVTARDGDALTAGAVSLTTPATLSDITGRAATFSAGATGATLVAARQPAFFRSQPFSLGNDRLVVAGWVSTHAAWYIGVVLLAALLLGASTWACLSYGRKSGHA